MSATAYAQFVNLDEFRRKLDRLGDAARGDALKRAAMAGGQVIEAYARINAIQQFSGAATNTLAGSIQTELIESTSDRAEIGVGPTVIYGRIQELGGLIRPVFAKALHFITRDGREVFAGQVQLPPRPYLRPAADDHQDDVAEAVGTEIRRSIEEAL